MQIKVFALPAIDDGGGEESERLNAFLRGHRILSIRRELTERDGIGYWSCCVEYLENGEPSSSGSGRRNTFGRGEKVDYRTVLDADAFARFVKLRECRRIVAEENHVPCYALWNDDVQAELAKLPELNKSRMMSVKGLGKGTFEKYGERVLAVGTAVRRTATTTTRRTATTTSASALPLLQLNERDGRPSLNRCPCLSPKRFGAKCRPCRFW